MKPILDVNVRWANDAVSTVRSQSKAAVSERSKKCVLWLHGRLYVENVETTSLHILTKERGDCFCRRDGEVVVDMDDFEQAVALAVVVVVIVAHLLLQIQSSIDRVLSYAVWCGMGLILYSTMPGCWHDDSNKSFLFLLVVRFF
jgi:hypothetical protein